MKIKVLKSLRTSPLCGCMGCGRNKVKGPYLKVEWEDEWEGWSIFCIPCLQTFRSQIDALSILVQTGLDTREDT